MREVMALVLSGGGGERLSVLTSERAVSAVPFGGKYRIIDFVLSNCCHSQIDALGVLTQHAPTSLHDHIGSGRPWDLDRRAAGVMLLQPYMTRSHAGWYRGTADAVAQNWSVIEEHRPARVLVLSGDHVYRMDYRTLFAAHELGGARVTIAVTRRPPEQSRRFGMVTLGPGGRVRRIEEKPQRTRAPFASMGIYLFETEVLGELLRGRPVDMVLDVLRPMLEAGEKIAAYEFSGYWEDVGTMGSYYRASLDLLAARPRLQLHDARWPILTRDEERPPVLIGAGAVIEDSLVANGCRVCGRVRRSILFPGVTVEPGAEVVDSVIMADAVVGAGAWVGQAIVDKYARIGARAEVGYGPAAEGGELSWLEGLVLVGKDAMIPPRARVGRPVVLGIGTGPEAFRDGELPGGTLVPNRFWYENMT